MPSRRSSAIATVLCACSLLASVASLADVRRVAAQDESPVLKRRAAPVSEAFEASPSTLRPPVTPVESLPVLAVDREGKLVTKPRRLWDIMKVLPIVFYTPETSVGLGAGALFLFNMPGAVAERRPSSVSLAGIYTLEKQMVAQVVPELRFGDDDFVLRLELLATKFPSRFYGIGDEVKSDVYDTFTDRYLRTGLDLRVRPFREGSPLRNVYVGAEYKSTWSALQDPEAHKAAQPSVFADLKDPGEGEQFTSGVGPVLAWDSRDGLNWPLGGSYVEWKALFNERWLQSTVRYQSMSLDARRYQPLWFSHILALRFLHRSTWGELPFQQLPQLGGANLFRGWFAGQLRDRHLTAIEAEYRLPLGDRWALVGFGSVGQVAPRSRDYSLSKVRAAGGAGLRFAIDKETRTNIRVDAAYGESCQFYVHFREAF